MPSRRVVVDPSHSAAAAFAAELRALLDGIDVPPTAAASGVSRAALYEALTGRRICSERTLAALLRQHFNGQPPGPGNAWDWVRAVPLPQRVQIEALRSRREQLASIRSTKARRARVRIDLPSEHAEFIRLLQRLLPDDEAARGRLFEALTEHSRHSAVEMRVAGQLEAQHQLAQRQVSGEVSEHKQPSEALVLERDGSAGPERVTREYEITPVRLNGYLRGDRIPGDRALVRLFAAAVAADPGGATRDLEQMRHAANRARAARTRARRVARRGPGEVSSEALP